MRVFIAGATGAVGERLVPQLVEKGHEVIGTSRSPEKADRLRAGGAEAVVLDVLDPHAVREAVAAARPDAVVHQATALAGQSDFKHFDRSFAQTNRLRTEGTDALLTAARETGVRRFVAQSFAGWPYARKGGPIKTEQDPLDPTPVPTMRKTLDAIVHLEQAVVDAADSRCATAVSTVPRRTRSSNWCTNGDSRSSGTAAVSGRSSTSTTRPPRPFSRSSGAHPGSTTSSTTNPPQSASGCPRSRRPSAPNRPAGSRAGSPGSWRARPASPS